MSDTSISVTNLSKCFKVYQKPWHRALEWTSFGKTTKHEDFWALRDICFDVEKGTCFGIIGPNGAGKSTLLKILTRSLYPTAGSFRIQGRVLSLLELGTGFNQHLTGRQNMYKSAQILGFGDTYVDGRIEAIKDFSELEDFFERPIRTYSTGMNVRLAFSMFAFMEPKVLIVDEALSVGDVFFQQKSFARMREIIESGTTCLFVSHDMSAVMNLCKEAVLLNRGEVEFIGDPEETVSRYLTASREKSESIKIPSNVASTEQDSAVADEAAVIIKKNFLEGREIRRHGDGALSIRALRVTDKNGLDTVQTEMMETLIFNILLQANEEVIEPRVAIRFFDRFGNCIFASGTKQLNHILPDMLAGENLVVRFDVNMNVAPGQYTFGLSAGEPEKSYSWKSFDHDKIDSLGPIVVILDSSSNRPFFGMAKLPMTTIHYKPKNV